MSLTFRAEETRTDEEEETPQCQAAVCRGGLREGQVAPQGACFASRETVAIYGDGGSGLAFHMNKRLLLSPPESRGPQKPWHG